MHLLVTGAGGLLGGNVVETSINTEHTVVGTFHNRKPAIETNFEQLDITDTSRFEQLITIQEPDAVVNCAAMTDVDGCEEHPERAREVNGEAPGRMAGVAAEYGIDFVHISTDYVFDGHRESRYKPEDKPNPIQEYGRSKYLGEQTVHEAHTDPLVARLSFVYGRDDAGEIEGFPAGVLDRLENQESTPLFTDQRVTPSRSESAANSILELCRRNATGTYHIAARDCVTPFEFGRKLASIAGKSAAFLEKGRMGDVDRTAERPLNTCLSVNQTESALENPLPTLEEDLRALLYSTR